MKTRMALVTTLALATMLGAGCATMNCCGGGSKSCACSAKAGAHKIIAAKLTVKADKADAFVAAATTIIAASRAEPGCVSYTLYRNPHEPTAFFFFEQWKNQAAIDFHFATPHFKAFGEQIKDMVAGAPEIRIFDACNETQPK